MSIPDRLTASLADRYHIERELGAGGMATVYLAEDLKHKRRVAVKVLKPELAAVLGAERFVVEITTTAALQHPHILPLFDSGEADGFLYYVMPFIDGETLRAKLDRETQLGVDEAVKITTDVADALHYAHSQGIVHRDIKPENILLQNGRPMVADFGIALAVSAAAGGRMTETGLSLGTPHYMSPEQATAEKEITARSDQYSLASVLYEMLTGNPPHTGASAQQIIMKIITEQAADVTSLRKSVPLRVADAIARALEKLPADRFASTLDFAAAIGGATGADGAYAGRATRSAGVAERSTARRQRAVTTGLAAIALSAVAVAAWALAGRDANAAAERVEFAYRPIGSQSEWPNLTISDDGRIIAQVVRDSNGVSRVEIRRLGSTQAVMVPGTEGAAPPQFTSDNSQILFVSQRKLKRVAVEGGPPSVVLDSAISSFALLPDGGILASINTVGLLLFSADGAFVRQVTKVDQSRSEFGHWYTSVLPDGKTVIFYNYTTPIANSRIEAVNVASGKRTVLAEGAIFPRYAESGHLLFVRNGALIAVPFDPKAVRVLGPEVPVLDNVAWESTDMSAGYDVSRNGTLVYVRNTEWQTDRRVLWADRSGAVEPALPDVGDWAEPRISPDGRWLAITRLQGPSQIWLYDRAREVLSQLTRSDAASFSSLWMPDSRSLLITREVPQYDIYRQSIDGTAATEVLSTPGDKYPMSLSRDGQRLAFLASATNRDALMTARLGQDTGTVVDAQPTDQRTADISPDGRWLAYSEQSANARSDVYVRSLNGSDGRRQLSAEGGDQPRFTKGGREIVYRSGAAMYAAPFDAATGEPGAPTLLFRIRDAGRLAFNRTVGYDVTPDGSRFLLVEPVDRPGGLPNVVITNWVEELRRKVPR